MCNDPKECSYLFPGVSLKTCTFFADVRLWIGIFEHRILRRIFGTRRRVSDRLQRVSWRTSLLLHSKLIFIIIIIIGDRGSTVVKVLWYKSEGRWFDSIWRQWAFIDIKSHYGPGVDSASNRNEYQEYFLGVKAVGE